MVSGSVKMRGPCQPDCVNILKTKSEIPSNAPKDIEFSTNKAPVRIWHCPFFNHIQRAKIQYLHHSHFIWKSSLTVCDLAKCRIEALDSVGSVYHLPYLGGVLEQPLDVDKIVVPDPDGRRVLLSPLRLCSEFSVNARFHDKTVHILRSSEPEAVTEPPPMAARSVLDRLA